MSEEEAVNDHRERFRFTYVRKIDVHDQAEQEGRGEAGHRSIRTDQLADGGAASIPMAEERPCTGAEASLNGGATAAAAAAAAEQEALRNQGIRAAVTFMEHPRVRMSSCVEKLAFLERKLPSEDVDEAFLRYNERRTQRVKVVNGGTNGVTKGCPSRGDRPAAAIANEHQGAQRR